MAGYTFTPERRQRVIDMLLAGAYPATAAREGGSTPRTLNRWLERGRAEADRVENGAEPEESEAEYMSFAVRADQALATAELAELARLREAPAGQWQKHAWVLERRWPEKYSLQQRQVVEVQHSGPDPAQVFGGGSPAEIARRANAVSPN
jgi:hypothetical protein